MKEKPGPLIEYLRDIKQLSFRQIEEQIGISRKKCSRIYSGTFEEPVKKTKILDHHRHLITQWYGENKTLTATQIYNRLIQRGIVVSYPSVAIYTKEFRVKQKKCYFELSFLPGEEAQVDWFFVKHPILGKLSGFVLVLSYSRYMFAHFFPRHSFEFFIEGHILAFEFIDGVPHALKYDNLKSVVLRRNPVKYNSAFLEFAKHHGFEIRLCNPASGNEKGRVERAIRSIRQSFLNIAEHHQSLRALNLALHQWTAEKNISLHRGTNKIPAEQKLEEELRPTLQEPWNNVLVHPFKSATKTGMLIFDSNAYSVPEYASGDKFAIYAYCDRLEIFNTKGKKVATHQRQFVRNGKFLNPHHRTFSKISKQAKMDRIYAAITRLDPLIEKYIHCKDLKNTPYQRAYCIFSLLSHHSKFTIISAIKEAIAHNISLDYLVFLLEAEKQPVAETVNTQNRNLLTLDYKPRPLTDYERILSK